MPEYLAPGVYVEEVDNGPKPIEGVSTSTAGFVGMTVKGASIGLPQLVTSFSDFQRKFGGYLNLDPTVFGGHTSLPLAVDGFFANGGKRAYIMRVKPGTSASATFAAKGGLTTKLKMGMDAAIGATVIYPATLRGINVGSQITLQMVVDGVTYASSAQNVTAINRSTGAVTLNAAVNFGALPAKYEMALSLVVLPNGKTAALTADAATGQDKIKLQPVTGLADGNTLVARMVKNGITYESGPIVIKAGGINAGTGEVTFTANIGMGVVAPVSFDARRSTVLTNSKNLDAAGLVDTAAAVPSSFTFNAKDEGAWGNALVIQVTHETGAKTEINTSVGTGGLIADPGNDIALKSTSGFYKNAWVEIDRGSQKRYRKVTKIQGLVITVDGPAIAAADVAAQAPATTTVISTCEFRVSASFNGITEQFPGLTLEKVTGKYYFDAINNTSSLIQVTAIAPASTNPFFVPSAANGLAITLSAGSDGNAPPTDAEYIGVDGGPGLRTGLKAMEDIDQVSILAAPGLTTQVMQNALIEQCERLKDRFAILDPKPKLGGGAPDLNDIQAQRQLYDTKYAALYYPRLLVADPFGGNDIAQPPSGHLAGIYARVDNERGVHKAPANEVVRNIVGLELNITKGEQEILNPLPLNINVLRDFRADGRGLRVWGARCITSDSIWKYINVRRLFIFLEESLDEGTQWVVFEPNDARLWKRVTQSVTNFLTRVWRDGALMGATPEQAFYVRCDETLMTQDDLDNGRLIMEIGVAPVKPAEFVIIRIGQKPSGAEVEEL